MKDAQDGAPRSLWRMGLLVGVLVVAAGLTWWVWAGRQAPAAMAPAVCADCGYQCETPVGVTPSLETWPRECPNCKHKTLYLGVQCRKCRKLIPMKDPSAEKYGTPDQCPWCKSVHRDS